MFSEPDFSFIKQNMKWRFLDSLDSIRYSDKEYIIRGAPVTQRVRQASVEVATTMLMGNGIVVPNNQLMDSVGFIQIFSEILTAASKSLDQGKGVIVPVKWAKYNYLNEIGEGERLSDPFNLVAYIFDLDGKDGRKLFELSAWHDLALHRKKWAKELRSEALIKYNNITNIHEYNLAEGLVKILTFFRDYRNEYVVEALSTKGIRDFMVSAVANLSEETVQQDLFFSKIINTVGEDRVRDRFTRIMDIINIVKKLNQKGFLDNRSEIREELTNKSEEYINKIAGDPNLACKGVLNTIYSIYNFSSFKSTAKIAHQDNQTEVMDKDNEWGYDEAAFALGKWARETYEKTNRKGKIGNDISAGQDSFVDPDVSLYSKTADKFWVSFFEYQRESNWLTTLTEYINSLKEMQSARRNYLLNKTVAKMNDYKSSVHQYEDKRNKHIENINKFLPLNHKIQIEKDEKAFLLCFDENGKIIEKVQVENFAENALLTKEEKDAVRAAEIANNITSKGDTVEFSSKFE